MTIGPPRLRPYWFWSFLGLSTCRIGLARALDEERIAVELVVPVVVVGRPPEAVGARLGGDADRGARRAAVFRGERARHDPELVDGIDRWTRDLGAELLDVGRDRVVVDPVEHEVVLERAVAMHADAAGAAGRRAARLLGITVTLHARHEGQQVVPVPDGQWQLGDFCLVDDLADDRGFGVDERRGPRHRDDFVHVAWRQREIDPGALPDLERQRLGTGLETGEFGSDLVIAGQQSLGRVRAFSVCHQRRHAVGRRVLQRDGHARHDRLRRVAYRSGHTGAIDLRDHRSARGDKRQGKHANNPRACGHQILPLLR